MTKTVSDIKIESLFNRLGDIFVQQHKMKTYNDRCKSIGLKNNAVLLNEYENQKGILKYSINEKIIDITYQYLINFGFPTDIEKYLKNKKRKNRTDEEKIETLRLKLLKGGATLLDTEWKGSNAQYKYKDFKGNIGYTYNSYHKFQKKNSIQSIVKNNYYIDIMKTKLAKKNLTLLTNEWINSYTLYPVMDMKGDIYMKHYYSIVRY